MHIVTQIHVGVGEENKEAYVVKGSTLLYIYTKEQIQFFDSLRSQREHFFWHPNSALDQRMKDTSAAAVDVAAGDGNKPWNSIGGAGSHVFVRRVMQIIMFLVGFAVLWMFLYNSAYPFGFPAISHYFVADSTQVSLSLSLFQIVFFFFCNWNWWRIELDSNWDSGYLISVVMLIFLVNQSKS